MHTKSVFERLAVPSAPRVLAQTRQRNYERVVALVIEYWRKSLVTCG